MAGTRTPKGSASAGAEFDALLAQAQKTFPPAVILGDGESIAGEFVRMDSGPTQGYGDAPIVVFKDALSGEEKALWLLHTALRTQVGRARPTAGEKFVCVKMGKRIAKRTNRAYEDYRFVVAGRDDGSTGEKSVPTFDDLLAAPAEDAAAE